jgi:serine acetyltransferase
MTKIISQTKINRFKSFAWRTSMMLLAFGVDYMVQYLTAVQIPFELKIAFGLFLGEVSKYLNTEIKLTEKKTVKKVVAKKKE